MSNLINVKINGKEVAVEKGITVLEAAEQIGINIPRLCYLKDINEISACRLCVVEIEGQRTLKTSCTLEVQEGMNIRTNSKNVIDSIRNNLELLASNHTFDCWACPREHNCEFLDLLRRYQIDNKLLYEYGMLPTKRIINDDSVAIVFDSGKCIQCGRCVSTCEKVAGLGIIDFINRGPETIVAPSFEVSMENSGCIYCGKCIQSCPTGAISEKSDINKVVDAIQNPDKFVVVQTAPAVRAALGEEFGLPIGTNVEGKMHAALRRLGFNEVSDTNFAADLTIMEEGTELIKRIEKGGPFPMFTSCSPGWIRFAEQYEQEIIENKLLSSAKSPHMMQGSIAKHYYGPKKGIAKENMYVVSIMPCIAKKYEITRPEMENEGIRDVDAVLTTRELAKLIKMNKIDFVNLPDEQPDPAMGEFSGGAVIFGATGGVMEAALRTAADILEGKSLDSIDYEIVRGTEDIKTASVRVAGLDLNIAVVHGGTAIKKFFEHVKETGKQYHFVEVMACTGGCVNGGGQPLIPANILEKIDVRKERAKALYSEDKNMSLRKSHNNKTIMNLYKEFLGEPNSHIAHKLLHTNYSKKSYYEVDKNK